MMRYCFILVWFFSTVNISAQVSNGHTSKNPNYPIICAHRGGFYKDHPENSFSAFNFTYHESKGAPVAIEFDLRKSRSGTLFVIHDETVDRTTNGLGKVSDLSDEVLKSLYLKNADGNMTTERIPTFDSLLGFSQNRNVVLMLDIKDDVWKEAIHKLVEKKLTYKSIILTFSPEDTRKVYELSREVRISCLIRNPGEWQAIKELAIPSGNLIAYINSSTSQELIRQLKSSLIMIMTDMNGTPANSINSLNSKYYLEFITKRRIDILITDYPVDVSRKLK